jgi:hypothetical protein
VSTPAQFAIKMHRVANDIKRAPRGITERGASTLKRSVQGTLAVAAPRGRLNVGKRGARIGVRYDLPSPSIARVFMFGPAHLIERDTKAHPIPREAKGRRRRKLRRLAIPGIGIRMSAMHPGTKGKHPWARGLDAGLPKVRRAAGDYYFDTFKKALR